MRWLPLSGLCWAKKTGIFMLGTLTIMTVGNRGVLDIRKEFKGFRVSIALKIFIFLDL